MKTKQKYTIEDFKLMDNYELFGIYAYVMLEHTKNKTPLTYELIYRNYTLLGMNSVINLLSKMKIDINRSTKGL